MCLNTAWAVLIFVTAIPQHPGANCTKCHLLPRTWCHLALFRKPEQPPALSCCPGLWQQPRGHDGTWSDTRPNSPSPKQAGPNPAVNCSMLSCTHVFLHSSRGLVLTGRKEHPSTWAKAHGDCTGKESQPSQVLKMQHNLSELPPRTAGACAWEADRKETGKHSGVLATDYWTNKE